MAAQTQTGVAAGPFSAASEFGLSLFDGAPRPLPVTDASAGDDNWAKARPMWIVLVLGTVGAIVWATEPIKARVSASAGPASGSIEGDIA